ncbi:MAG: hypothetical protein ABIA74_00885 [bacterium]
MKIKLKIFLITFLMSVNLVYGFDNNEQFSTANQLYTSGKFKEAMQAYQQIPEKNFQINYNLGNCFYKLGKYGQALLYWRRAESDWGILGRGELLENINLLQEKLSKDKKKGFNNFVSRFLAKVKNYFLSWIRSAPILFFQIMFLILWFILFVFLRILYKKKSKVVIITLFWFVFLFGISLVLRHSYDLSRYGIVILPKTILWSGPSNNFQQLGFLFEGSEVLINKKTDNFFKIKFNGQIGWVNENDVKEIISGKNYGIQS